MSGDQVRIGQLFSNLLGNALMHGAADKPVRVRPMTDATGFELAVANAGEPILAAARERVFQPFTRGAAWPSQQGPGLGLFIATEVPRAHGGEMSVVSTEAETRFTFRMALA